MPITIDSKQNRFVLETDNTLYIMGIYKEKYPLHIYYGKKCESAYCGEMYTPPISFAGYYEDDKEFLSDTAMAEFPIFGGGDNRATALRIRHLKSGCDVSVFKFVSARAFKGRRSIEALPFAEANENTETLEITLFDSFLNCTLKLYYTVFPECDVISRYFVLENGGKDNVKIEKCMSLCLDLPTQDYDLISFYGTHAFEMYHQRKPIMQGNQRVFSRRGASSHQFNPFVMLAHRETDEEQGDAYGFNIVYSGNFLDEVETEQTGTSRILVGIGEENFSWLLESGESFASPEAVMSFSDNGIGQVSRNMHRFIKNHISPPDIFQKRPVVLNSWEAVHFDIDANVMNEFAKQAAECNIDMLVMDDGWFGKRVNATAGLGDWFENKDRFPNGLKSFVEQVKETGLKFGIWIEPEMVNPDSELFRAHPDWIIKAPEREQLLSRNQYVLDMTNRDIINYLKGIFEKTFKDVPIDYFKWDMNRHLTMVYSPTLPPERQQEVAHRYMLAVYELFEWFNKTFPDAMIENCSGGGGRYDIGMMKYSTQIWTSDNTVPNYRTVIQYGSTFGYPVSVMSCHVANKDGSMENERLFDYGFRTALNGVLGYELNILNASDKVKESIKEQIAEYRNYEDIIINGDFYRLLNPMECDRYAYYFVNSDNSEILFTYLQNCEDENESVYRLKISRAESDAVYTDTISGKKFLGVDLNNGIEIKSDKNAFYVKMLHLVK